MARCGCGSTCGCALTNGDNTTVTGSGTPANPWQVNATVDCTDVRGCISANQGAEFNAGTGVISVCVSPNAGNSLTRDANGCLYVSPGNNAVVSGCGITGTGTAGSPLAVEGKAWPFACDQDSATAQGVYCDPVTGFAHGDPSGAISYYNDSEAVALPGTGILVPAVADTPIRPISLDITNTDPCRSAEVLLWQDVDCDMDLPPGSGGMYGLDGDDMVYIANEGGSTILNTHMQAGKLRRLTLAPGETQTVPGDVTAGRGTGGARIRRIQWAMRAWVITIP